MVYFLNLRLIYFIIYINYIIGNILINFINFYMYIFLKKMKIFILFFNLFLYIKCQNFIVSYSNTDAVFLSKKLYQKFHNQNNEWLEKLKDVYIENEYEEEESNVILKNVTMTVKSNEITPYIDYNQNITIFSPNPLTIIIEGDLYINNINESRFSIKQNIFFYSLKQEESINEPNITINYKYKPVNKTSELKFFNNTIEKKYKFIVIKIITKKILPQFIQLITNKAELSIEKLFKTEDDERKNLRFVMSNLFGEYNDTIDITGFFGFCKNINNSIRVFCFKDGSLNNNINDKGMNEFMNDIFLTSLSNLNEKYIGIYFNYQIINQIFTSISNNKEEFYLNENTKFKQLPIMNVRYLKNIFQYIPMYYPISTNFTIKIVTLSIENYDLNNLLYKGKFNMSLELNLDLETNETIFESIIETQFKANISFDIYNLNLKIDSCNITNFIIASSILKVKQKQYLKDIIQEWIDISLKEDNIIFEEPINLMNYIIYVEEYSMGKNGFFIKGRKNDKSFT